MTVANEFLFLLQLHDKILKLPIKLPTPPGNSQIGFRVFKNDD